MTTVLAHRIDGSGRPIVLLNGIAMSMASWAPIAAQLAKKNMVIRCDLRGQLLSPGPAHRNVQEHANDVAVLLDHLGVDSTHILATSFGGAVGAIFAAVFPEKTRSLVSIASADAFDLEMAEEIQRWRRACVEILEGKPGGWLGEVFEPVVYSSAYLESHPKEREAARFAMGEIGPRWFSGLIGLLDSADSFDLVEILGKIRCPTLIAAAELDAFIPRERCRTLSRKIPRARFEVIAEAGHAVVAEDPDAVLALVGDFLSTLD